VPRVGHVHIHVLKHLAVLARDVTTSHYVVHEHRDFFAFEHHLQTIIFVLCKLQDFVVTSPLVRVAVAIRGVSVHNKKFASPRAEPHSRDAAAVTTAVGVGRGEVENAGPTFCDSSCGFDVNTDLEVQREVDFLVELAILFEKPVDAAEQSDVIACSSDINREGTGATKMTFRGSNRK